MKANMEILHVSKQYKNGVTALEDVSFCVGSGVFWPVGPQWRGENHADESAGYGFETIGGYDSRLRP